jgi:hypothetical protein
MVSNDVAAYGASAAIMIITVLIHLAYKCSTGGNTAYGYSPAAALTMAELFKLGGAITLLCTRGGGPREFAETVSLRFALKSGTLAMLYFIGNHVAFRLFLSVAMATITSFKSLVPALTAVIYTQVFVPLVSLQWLAISLQVLGVFLMHFDACEHILGLAQADLSLLMLASAITSVAGVANELLLKNADVPLHAQNTVLYTWGALLNGILFVTTSTLGFFEGFTPCAVAVVACNSVIGLCITAIYKYADVNTKNYVVSLATVPVMFLAPFVNSKAKIDVLGVLGAVVVVASTVLYFFYAPKFKEWLHDHPPTGYAVIPSVEGDAQRRRPWLRALGIVVILATAFAMVWFLTEVDTEVSPRVLVPVSSRNATHLRPDAVPQNQTTASVTPIVAQTTASVTTIVAQTTTVPTITTAATTKTTSPTTMSPELHCIPAESTPLCLTATEEGKLRMGYGDQVMQDDPDSVAVCLTGAIRTFYTHGLAPNIINTLTALDASSVTVFVDVFADDVPLGKVSPEDAEAVIQNVAATLHELNPTFRIVPVTGAEAIIPMRLPPPCIGGNRIGNRSWPQYERIRRCAQTVRQDETLRGKKFNWFFRLRPDIWLTNPPALRTLQRGALNGGVLDSPFIYDQWYIIPTEIALPFLDTLTALLLGCYSPEFTARIGREQLPFTNENKVWPEIGVFLAAGLMDLPIQTHPSVTIQKVT